MMNDIKCVWRNYEERKNVNILQNDFNDFSHERQDNFIIHIYIL